MYGEERIRLAADRHAGPVSPFVYKESYDSLAILVERNVAVNVTGFLVAISEGYYEAEGLPPVTAVLQDANTTVLDGFYSGRIQFATNMLPRICRYVSDGYEMVVLAQLIPHSTFGIAIRTDLNPDIHSFKDFSGKKVAVYYRDEENFYIPFSSLNLKVTMVPVQTHGSILLRKGVVQGIGTHSYDYPIVANFMKYRDRIRFLSFADIGYDLPEDCLICHREFLFRHPEMCQKFVRASFRGWKKAFEDKPKAIKILTDWYRKQNSLVDTTVSMDQLEAFEKVMNFKPVLEDNGKFSKAAYQSMIDRMIRARLVSKDKVPSFEQLCYPVMQSETMARLKQQAKQAKSRLDAKEETEANAKAAQDLSPATKGGKP